MLTQNQLKEYLHYNANTGMFTRIKSGQGIRFGSIAGRIKPSGYLYIGLQRQEYYAHRLAFLFMTGTFPSNEIDHINGVKDDNRWFNLREATPSENKCNIGKYNNNTSGFKGVSWNKVSKKLRADIQHMNNRIYLGLFDSPESAHQVYIATATRLHGEFANFG